MSKHAAYHIGGHGISDDPHLDFLLSILDGIEPERRQIWMWKWCPRTMTMMSVNKGLAPIRTEIPFAEFGAVRGAHNPHGKATANSVHFVGAR